MINSFLYCIDKMNFSGSPKGTPHDWCRRILKKTILPWKPMELGGVHQKNNNIFIGDLYSMYVVLQRIGSLSCIRAL